MSPTVGRDRVAVDCRRAGELLRLRASSEPRRTRSWLEQQQLTSVERQLYGEGDQRVVVKECDQQRQVVDVQLIQFRVSLRLLQTGQIVATTVVEG